MKAHIKAISYYLPEEILTNSELVLRFPEWTVEKVASKIGIKERHIAGKNETSTDMAIKAGQMLLDEYQIDPQTIDFVMLCTQSPDYFLPTSACIIQDRLKIPVNSGAIDFNLGCSGFVYGLALAKGLIASGIAKNILLITSETYSKFIHPKDKSNLTIFGDGAAATLISTNGFAEILNFSLGTDGRGVENLIVTTGGMRNKRILEDTRIDDTGVLKSSDHLYMNGSEIFNFTLENVPTLVSNTLINNDMNIDNIDLFVFHQANKYMLNFLRKKIQIPEEKFFYFMENVGNTVSSTIPIAVKEAQNEGVLKGNVVLAGFGVGYSWGGVMLNIY